MTPWQETAALRNFDPADVCFGSWLCKNVLAAALTPRDFGRVAVLVIFPDLSALSAWKCS